MVKNLVLFCLVLGLSSLAFGKTKDLDHKRAKLTKLGIKKKKIQIVMDHEKKLSKDLDQLKKDKKLKSAARKNAEVKLVKAHEKFLKQTLTEKMYAAYYKSSPQKNWQRTSLRTSRTVASLKKKKPAAPPEPDFQPQVIDDDYVSPNESPEANPTAQEPAP